MGVPTVAVSKSFFTSFAALPRNKQGRVTEFISKFCANPKAPGINCEKIQGAAEPDMYSVRIDEAYRAVVVRPEDGGEYLLLWVDHHDRAYRWARRKRCRVNPMTGVVQVYDAQLTMDEPEVHGSREETVKSPFAGVTDRQLLRMGVPEEKLAETRAITTIEELYSRKDGYPEDAYENLEMVAAGFSVDEVLEHLREAGSTDAQLQLGGFAVALSNLPATRIMPAQRARSAPKRSAFRVAPVCKRPTGGSKVDESDPPMGRLEQPRRGLCRVGLKLTFAEIMNLTTSWGQTVPVSS